jgi:hypothetical protein
MSFDNVETRGRLQLSRLLYAIELDIEEILASRAEKERNQLTVRVLDLYGAGAHKYLQIIEETETGDDDFMRSPYAILHGDALELALTDIDGLASLEYAELYASLASVILSAIPLEFRWTASGTKAMEIVDPIELIEMTVLAVSAMDVVHKAKQLFETSAGAKRRASKAHVENRAMKAKAFEWCDRNLASFKSLDAAAAEISKTQMPITFRTARSWVGDWKKLQSASTL